jgi:SAM-dependent methyltransferase
MPDRPELSDLIVHYDPDTLERRDVTLDAVLARLPSPASARRVARALAPAAGVLDRDRVDGVLVRSHLELQRLHEEFRVGALMRDLLVPMIALVRARAGGRRIRVVDLGCGLGFVVRWLAARGGLGADVDLVGADCNRALVAAAQRLADEERLPCRFVAANAFRLEQPADVIVSTGVLHHFRGGELAAVFADHERAPVAGFVHVDIRPSAIAPIGSWIFHRARMREPLARFDGVRSVVRAHGAGALCSAAAAGAPSFALAHVDAHPGLAGLLRIFQCLLGARDTTGPALREAYAAFGGRVQLP